MSVTSLSNPGIFTQVGGWTIVDKTSSDATWAIPSGVANLNVLIIGGGGGGGSGALAEGTDGYGGAGGAGGNALIVRNLSTAFLTRHSKTVPIVIGAGGAGGVGSTGNNAQPGTAGSAGGTSSFGPFSASGGGGGGAGTDTVGTTAANPVGGVASSNGFTYGPQILLPGALSTQDQVVDFFNTLSGAVVYSSSNVNILTFVGGSGGVGGGFDYNATNGVTAVYPSTSGTYPTTTSPITSSTFEAVFSAGGVGGGEITTATSNTSLRGAGLVAGFSGGGGGAGGSATSISIGNAAPAARGRDGYFGGGGGGGGVRNNNDNRTVSTTTAAGGAGAANTGGGGGGGGSSFDGTMTSGSSYSGSGGNGGSGRVIIFYRT